MGPDGELVAACLAGDRRAFAALVDRHRHRVQAVVRRMLPPADAEDVTQEAILAAYLELRELRDPDRFAAWVCAIAVNLAKMRLRSRREFLADRLVPDGVDPAAEASPDEAVEARELWELVRGAVEVLPEDQRDAVLMHYVDGLAPSEIAALLGEPAGTVRVRLHRARARLRARLSPHVALRKEKQMVEVMLEDVVVRVVAEDADRDEPRLASEKLRIVLLAEKEGDRVLPIWIGASEGDALALQLGGETFPRPVTSDLMARLLEVAGARVERVSINELRENTFYATVTVSDGRAEHDVDARPSDALNLAARVGAPIFVDDAVLDRAGIASQELPAKLDEESPVEEDLPESAWRSLTPAIVKALHPPFVPRK